MYLVFSAIALFLLGGLAALVTKQREVGAWSSTLASLLGLAGASLALWSGSPENLSLPATLPLGAWTFTLDSLAALFLVLLFVLGLAGSLYGRAYWQHECPPLAWPMWNALLASMALVLLAANGLPFMIAWEAMAVTSFFLVTLNDREPGVRDAGKLYLVASQAGALALLVFFLLLDQEAHALDFARFAHFPAPTPLLLLIALFGFGLKAGLFPLHVWLPEAHPVAPSHVSALMSGLMIKLGIYGILRTLTWLGPPELWWGWLLIVLGLASGLAGILYALVQSDFKRLLAYSSIENIGLITLGLGLGTLGWASHQPLLAIGGFTAAFWHLVHHALAKAWMFLAAGIVAHQTGTLDVERLGGLMKRMPGTGSFMLFGAMALGGLPPLAGFVGEFVLFTGTLKGIQMAGLSLPSLIAMVGLAMIAGLTVAAFTRAIGTALLGEPRDRAAAEAQEAAPGLLAPVRLLTAAYLTLALFAPSVWPALTKHAADLFDLPLAPDALMFPNGLNHVLTVSACLILVTAALWGWRQRLLSRQGAQAGPTWDCGYKAPTARMQYTAASFAQPLAAMFVSFLPRRTLNTLKAEPFPDTAHYLVETPDVALSGWLRPAYRGLRYGLSLFRWLQHGHLHLYVLYITLTLIGLLVWRLD